MDNFVIDTINIRQANKEAMRRAIVELQRKLPPLTPLLTKEGKAISSAADGRVGLEVLIDGKDNYKFDELEKKPVFII
ncbi:MAG: hypothetical protein H6767_05425 [Candidatus Peribacteria bacterium]|nr:MAG: hypothetical protein H6767_05425 [Candidatus Peribacteria bacterium]